MSAHAGQVATPMRSPKIEGPITGGTRGHIHGGFAGDLAEHGYIEEEYFVSGMAQGYKPVGALGDDGRWTVAPDQSAEYKTRVIVHRPRDPAKFNGVIMCEWTNVSTLSDLSNAVNEPFYKSGYVYIAVSAQKAGVEGLDSLPSSGLRRWDPDRYGSLHIPGDGYSYDIFTQIARALARPAHRSGADPLSGLEVRHSLATGQSQSAARLATYVNAIHPIAQFFSGFIPCALMGGGSELGNFDVIPEETIADYNRRFFSRIVSTRIRDDLKTPILIMLSETEARRFRVPPQPDAAWLRVWEIAGAVHGSACDTGYRADVSARDGIEDPIGTAKDRMVRFMPTMEAAGLAIVRWVEGGAPLARQPRLLRGKDLRTIEVDENCNALGGVGLPEMQVPTATLETVSSPARGVRTPFSADKLHALYPSDENYLNKIKAAVADCRVRDLLLDHAAADYVERARQGPLAESH